MGENAKLIISNITSAMEQMTPTEQAQLAAFSEGLAYMASRREAEQQSAD